MSHHFIPTPHHPLATPVEGSDPVRRAHLGALVVAAVLVTVLGIGAVLAVPAQPATAERTTAAMAMAAGHSHGAASAVDTSNPGPGTFAASTRCAPGCGGTTRSGCSRT